MRLIVPLTDLDHLVLAEARDEPRRRRSCSSPATETIARCSDKYQAHVFFEEPGIGSPPTWLPTELPEDDPLPGAREGAQGLRLAPHLPRRERGGARLLPALHDGRLDGAGRVPRRGVLDRRLLRPRRALPRRDPAHDDRVEGRRIDQGHDDQGRRADRVRLPRVRGAARSSAPRTCSASASRTASCRSPTSTRASAAASRCRPPPARAIPSSRSRSRTASSLEPRLGDFREGVVMTRFFSQVILEERDGSLQPRAGGGGARGGVRRSRCSSPERRCSPGCGSRHEAATTVALRPPASRTSCRCPDVAPRRGRPSR